MFNTEYTEKDWKLFKTKIADWQEKYMAKLCLEYVSILNSECNASEKFWSLEKKIKKDKRNCGVIVEMTRSKLVLNIVSLLNEDAITLDDLEEFSDELKETMGRYFNC